MKVNLLHPTRERDSHAPCFSTHLEHFEPDHVLYLKEYGRIVLRPIRIDDEAAMVAFHEGLSEESIFLRYFEHISLDTRTLHERLARVCANTADSYAIVAETRATSHHPAKILAVGRLTTTETPHRAGFALLIDDGAKDTTLPLELLKRLMEIAKAFHFTTLSGELLVGDHDTMNLCRDLKFTVRSVPEDGLVRVVSKL